MIKILIPRNIIKEKKTSKTSILNNTRKIFMKNNIILIYKVLEKQVIYNYIKIFGKDKTALVIIHIFVRNI